MKMIDGGVCAPLGFMASGIYCGIRRNKSKKDLGLIYSSLPCVSAAVYTQNRVKGAPLTVTNEHLLDGKARAVIINSGNANTCNRDGVKHAKMMCRAVSELLRVDETDVLVASTGVIGAEFPIDTILDGVPILVESLSEDGSGSAAESILTTDRVKKEFAVTVTLPGGKKARIGLIAKGSGMINPNMATMLCFITTDVNITGFMLDKALRHCTGRTINMISVDGDTSTNDMTVIMANGLSGNALIDTENEAYDVFVSTLFEVMRLAAKALAADGEGATKLIECRVTGASNESDARKIAKAVISSDLVKTAMFGEDANFGRILCAIGYSGANVDVNGIGLEFASDGGRVAVCEDGYATWFDEDNAKRVLGEREITLEITLRDGDGCAVAWGCDLSYDYVKINGDYRT